MGRGLINKEKNRFLKTNGFEYKVVVLKCPIYIKREGYEG
jgi:hypothetical protein